MKLAWKRVAWQGRKPSLLPHSRLPSRTFSSSTIAFQREIPKFPFQQEQHWKPVIGLEIHAQISSRTKLFSGASVETNNASPNSNVALLDAAFPGSLPVLNRYCVQQAIKTGLSLGGSVNLRSSFDRKHYFYPDLPLGYQITQYYEPIVSGGQVEIEVHEQKKAIRISRIQLEQDSGKSLHDQHPSFTLIDLNRAGVPLMEIITEPEFNSSEEVAAFLSELQKILRQIGASSANMELGELRCDVNVSLHKPGTPFGTRCEVKNINSIKFATKAIDFEISRQEKLLENGIPIIKETRYFDASQGETFSMREKEDEIDYRFFPEPDLPPLILQQEEVEAIRRQLPELPSSTKAKLISKYQLTAYESQVLMEYGAHNYFEQVASLTNPKRAASWIMNDLFAMLKEQEMSISQVPIPPEQFASMIDLLEQGLISSAIGKDLLFTMFNGDKRKANDIVKEKGWIQESDTQLLEKLCSQVIQDFPNEVEQYKKGKDRVFRHFVGQVMKLTKGKANPERVTEILKEKLKS